MPTRLDPDMSGESKAFADPATGDADWKPTKTYSSTWDAQGLANQFARAAWYRHRFTLPADAGDQPVGLFVADMTMRLRVWINGVFVGSSGTHFTRRPCST